MTDQQINAAIAEACGWECIASDVWHNGLVGYSNDTHGIVRSRIPDYCHDLNAMHEAEKALAPKNWNNFKINWWNYYQHLSDGDVQKTIHATARQRAEAFLRTLGKWEEAE